MSRKPNVFPSYLLHKQSGQARVRISGRDHLLGPYGSNESRIAYGELVAKLAGGLPIDPLADSKRGSLPRNESDDPGPSVGELCLAFLRHAETHYVKNGKPTSELHIMKAVIRPLNELYGLLPAKDFGPLALKAVRQKFVDLGWVRVDIVCQRGKFLREPKKGLIPLSRSGSGLKTIFLVLLNLLIIPVVDKKPVSEFVYAFEELENNLHPALLRRLFKYLADFVTKERCTLFLTTHSSVALDFFGIREDSKIIQVSHCGESASTVTVQAHFDRVGLLSELGARPSDLLQSNGVLWLEGPSDRIYFNRFIELFSNGELNEGRDYQCAFYGGSVLAKTGFYGPENADEELANLLRLNNNIAVVCDGDRTAAEGEGSELKARVQRIKSQVDVVPESYFWATESKEIENYVPGSVWGSVYAIPGIPDPGPFDKFPAGSVGNDCFVAKHCGRKSFDKCKFAADAAPHLTMELLSGNGEFVTKIQELVATIRKWNQ